MTLLEKEIDVLISKRYWRFSFDVEGHWFSNFPFNPILHGGAESAHRVENRG